MTQLELLLEPMKNEIMTDTTLPLPDPVSSPSYDLIEPEPLTPEEIDDF